MTETTEISEEMQAAGIDALGVVSTEPDSPGEVVIRVWRAMLKASETKPVAPTDSPSHTVS